MIFFIERTDTFAGNCNYCWLQRLAVKATTARGAANVMGREFGPSRCDGIIYHGVKNPVAWYFVEDPAYGVKYEPLNFGG